MKIAYYCTWNFDLNDGVTSKISYQVNYWKGKGNNVRIFNKYSRKCGIRKLIRTFYDHQLLKDLGQYDPDVVYIRFEVLSITQLFILNRYKCVIESNTDDVEELRINRSLYARLKFLYNLYSRKIVYRRTSGIVFVTHELQKKKYMNPYNKPSIVCPNPIIIRYDSTLSEIVCKNNSHNLVFIGTPNQAWHGLDRIERIAALTPQITYHIVGTANRSDDTYNGLSNVKYHGYLKRSEYMELCQRCDAAIGTMGLYRKNLKEACPLKTREYIAMGLPIIIGYNDTMFSEIEILPWWVLVLPNDKSADKNVAECIELFLDKVAHRRIPQRDIETFASLTNCEEKRFRFLSSLAKETEING